MDLSKNLKTKLDTQLNKAVRFVFSLPHRAPTSNSRKKLKWMTLTQRRKYFLLTLTFQTLNTKKPPYLYDILRHNIIDYTQPQYMTTRHRPFFRIPFKSSNSLDASFYVAAMKAWNSLPEDIRTIEDLNSFKSKIKAHLMRPNVTS